MATQLLLFTQPQNYVLLKNVRYLSLRCFRLFLLSFINVLCKQPGVWIKLVLEKKFQNFVNKTKTHLNVTKRHRTLTQHCTDVFIDKMSHTVKTYWPWSIRWVGNDVCIGNKTCLISFFSIKKSLWHISVVMSSKLLYVQM